MRVASAAGLECVVPGCSSLARDIYTNAAAAASASEARCCLERPRGATAQLTSSALGVRAPARARRRDGPKPRARTDTGWWLPLAPDAGETTAAPRSD